jgi:hypothetical protein
MALAPRDAFHSPLGKDGPYDAQRQAAGVFLYNPFGFTPSCAAAAQIEELVSGIGQAYARDAGGRAVGFFCQPRVDQETDVVPSAFVGVRRGSVAQNIDGAIGTMPFNV